MANTQEHQEPVSTPASDKPPGVFAGHSNARPPKRMRFLPALAVCLVALPWGIAVFTLLVTGMALGAGLLVILIGLPILAGGLHLARSAADAEWAVLQWATNGATSQATRKVTPRSWSELWGLLRNSEAWRDLTMLLLRLPLGIMSFTLSVVLVVVPVSYLTAPLTYRWVNIWTITGEIQTLNEALLAVPQGLLIGAVTLFAIPAMGRLFTLSAPRSRSIDHATVGVARH